MRQSLRVLLADVVDYAGLFPPARLSMSAAVESFARARRSTEAWMLGRFVCPASRLDELAAACAVLQSESHPAGNRPPPWDVGTTPWSISAVVDGDLTQALAAVQTFNRQYAPAGRSLVQVDCLELRVQHPADVASAADRIPPDLLAFYEISTTADDELLAAVAGAIAERRGAAKMRLGGLTPQAIPPPRDVARFLWTCHAAGASCKATAGLHHALPGEYPLTYEPDAPCGTMHGFINLLVAAAAVWTHGSGPAHLEPMLCERDPAQFRFTDEGVRWRDVFVETALLAETREAFLLSFGSCSFDEPVADLRALHWL